MKTPIPKPRAENHRFTKTKSNPTKLALRTPQYINPEFTNHEECHKEDPPLIDVLQNLLRRKTLGTYYYFMHAGAFEKKAEITPLHKHTPNPPKKKKKTKSKNPREKPVQDQENQVCERRREKGERGRRTDTATKTISSTRRRRRRRGR